MPYRLYQDGELLRLDLDQAVTIAELAELGRTVEKLESDLRVAPHRITDLSKTTGIETKFDDVLAFAQRRKARAFPNAFKSAIVAPLPVHVGVARMFATLNDHPQITIRIIASLEAAKAWIGEP